LTFDGVRLKYTLYNPSDPLKTEMAATNILRPYCQYSLFHRTQSLLEINLQACSHVSDYFRLSF